MSVTEQVGQEMAEGILVARGLEKVYRKEGQQVAALRGVDLAIKEGEFVAIVGPSGSGKTTLLHILGTLDMPTSGHVLFKGQNLSSLDDLALSAFRCRNLGFVFQAFNLIPELRAWENVALPLYYQGVSLRERRERALAVLGQLGLADRAQHYPSELSGGEEQRVAIARALVSDPSVIMADEPTGNLDSVTGEHVQELILSLNRERGITVVLVTHNLELAALADRIVQIRDGLVVAGDGAMA